MSTTEETENNMISSNKRPRPAEDDDDGDAVASAAAAAAGVASAAVAGNNAVAPVAAVVAAAAAAEDDDDDEVDDDDDDEIQIVKVNPAPALAPRNAPPPASSTSHRGRLNEVYIVLTCNYPLQKDKRGESSGHETEDTEIIGVYAQLKDANRAAKDEAYQYGEEEEEDEEEEDEDDEDSGDLFDWQEDEPAEWTARRVWVEQKTIAY